MGELTAPPEDDPNEDLKDVVIRNLRAKVRFLERKIADMRDAESWRINPDRMGS